MYTNIKKKISHEFYPRKKYLKWSFSVPFSRRPRFHFMLCLFLRWTLCGGAQSPGVPSRGRTGTGEEGSLSQTATQRRRTSQMTPPPHWGTTLPMVRRSLSSSVSPPIPAYVLISVALCVLGLKQLLDAQQLCDVTLLVEGKKFMCHRCSWVTLLYSAVGY